MATITIEELIGKLNKLENIDYTEPLTKAAFLVENEAKKKCLEEVKKMESMLSYSSEYHVIKNYIVNNCISSENYYLINYKDDIKIYFYIDYLDNFRYSVEIHDIYIVDQWGGDNPPIHII